MPSLRAIAPCLPAGRKKSSWTLGGLLFVYFAYSSLQAHAYHPRTLWSSPKITENVIGVRAGHLVNTDEVHWASLSPSRLAVYALREQTLHKMSWLQPEKGDQWVKLSLVDIDADGIEELVVSGFRGDQAHSFLLSAREGPFRILTEIVGHLAVIWWNGEKTLFAQRSLGGGDFTGPLRKMKWDGKKLTEIESVKLPGGISGHSPSLFRTDGFSPGDSEVGLLYQSETGPLVSYRFREGKWKKDWTSGASYGGFSIHLDREVRSPLNQVEKGRFFVPVSKRIVSTENPISMVPVVIPATSETNLSPPSTPTLSPQGRGGVEADNRLRVYVIRQEGYLHNVIGAVPSAKNSQVVRLISTGYGFQEDWNSPRFDGAITDFDLVDWDGDGTEEILASLLLRDGGYFDTLKKQDSILIVIDAP